MVIELRKDEIVFIVRENVSVPEIENYQTYVYNNVLDGLQAIKNKPYVIFIDLGLTRVTGIDCLKIIRLNPFNHQIKIVVCAKKYSVNLLKKAFNMGADFFLKIPFVEEEIKYILNDIRKNMQYFSLEDAITFSSEETSIL